MASLPIAKSSRTFWQPVDGGPWDEAKEVLTVWPFGAYSALHDHSLLLLCEVQVDYGRNCLQLKWTHVAESEFVINSQTTLFSFLTELLAKNQADHLALTALYLNSHMYYVERIVQVRAKNRQARNVTIIQHQTWAPSINVRRNILYTLFQGNFRTDPGFLNCWTQSSHECIYLCGMNPKLLHSGFGISSTLDSSLVKIGPNLLLFDLIKDALLISDSNFMQKIAHIFNIVFFGCSSHSSAMNMTLSGANIEAAFSSVQSTLLRQDSTSMKGITRIDFTTSSTLVNMAWRSNAWILCIHLHLKDAVVLKMQDTCEVILYLTRD